MHIFYSMTVFVLLAWLGCSSGSSTIMSKKFDAPLRLKLQELQKDNRKEALSVFGKCSQPINDSLRADLVKHVQELQSVTGDIFTARVASDRIMAVADLAFVTQLQLSQESKPLSP